jgi:hypothetical protein
MIPPELHELTLSFYSSDSLNASGELMDIDGHTISTDHVSPQKRLYLSYLMKSVSRSWSRLTNDFIVR